MLIFRLSIFILSAICGALISRKRTPPTHPLHWLALAVTLFLGFSIKINVTLISIFNNCDITLMDILRGLGTGIVIGAAIRALTQNKSKQNNTHQ